MSRFFVGQRVRIVGADPNDAFAYLVGSEGVVTGFWEGIEDGSGEYRSDWVEVDVFCVGMDDVICRPHELEPLSDSNALVSWESMRDLWMPEHLRVAA